MVYQNQYPNYQPYGPTPTPQVNPQTQPQPTSPPLTQNPLFTEQSYIENILRMNRGKLAKFYMSFTDSDEWKNKVFTGIIEEAGRDHIIISDPNTGMYYLLLMVYLDYVSFDEPINYNLTFPSQNL